MKLKVRQNNGYIYPISLGLTNSRDFHSSCHFISHRGFSSEYPENTMPAFKAAIAYGYRQLETDIVQSSDGVQFCLHDATVNRTSSGSGTASSLTSEKLLSFDYGYSTKFGNKFSGTKIPTLEEFLLFCKRNGCYAELDLADNTRYSDAYLQNTYDVVKKCNMLKMTFFVAKHSRLEKLYEIDSNLMLSVSECKTTSEMDAAKTAFGNAIEMNFSIPYPNLTKALVQYAHSLNVPIKTWYADYSADTVQTANKIFEWGVESVISECMKPNEFPW